MKKIILILLIIIILCGGGYFAYRYFDLGKYFNQTGKTEENVEKPKLKIFDEKSKSRVIGVAINNHHDAWPHSGLQDSYLNYELIAEGGITRILAFYKDSKAERIGSVRSARHYFLDYMLENDAIFVHYGHSDLALSDVRSLGMDDIDGIYSESTFFRDKSLNKDYEHTAFTSMSLIKSKIESEEFRDTSDKGMLLKYSIESNKLSKREDAIKADEVYIEYSDYTDTKYVYDKDAKVYKRYMDNKEHIDSVTNNIYTAKNIIVYKVSNYSIDSYGRQNLSNIGTGEGYYISEGYAVPITWTKSERSGKTVYIYSDGSEIKVNDGNTWIQIQPKNKVLDIIEYEDTSEE